MSLGQKDSRFPHESLLRTRTRVSLFSEHGHANTSLSKNLGHERFGDTYDYFYQISCMLYKI